jgi:sarcosine oxidase subunit beta
MRMLDQADVCIIGGGLVGANLAYDLVRKRKQVILIEREFLASGASGSTFALIGFQWFKYDTGMPVVFIEYCKESYKLYKSLTKELDGDFEYRITGSIVTIETTDELEQRTEIVDALRKNGLEIWLLDKAETLKKEPSVNPGMLGSTFCPLEGEINPFRLVTYTIRRANDLGARIYTHTKVEAIDLQNGQVKGLFTDRGRVKADCIINASGSSGADIGRMAGLEIPLKMQKGQVLVTESMPPLITRQVHTIKKVSVKKGELPIPVSTEIVQKPSGNLFLGGTREDLPSYETKNTPDGIKTVAKKAIHLIPGLRDVRIIRAFAGVRHIPLDGYPILGEAEAVRGFFNAILHAGIMLAPIVGQITSDLITRGKSQLPIESYLLSRFQSDADRQAMA